MADGVKRPTDMLDPDYKAQMWKYYISKGFTPGDIRQYWKDTDIDKQIQDSNTDAYSKAFTAALDAGNIPVADLSLGQLARYNPAAASMLAARVQSSRDMWTDNQKQQAGLLARKYQLEDYDRNKKDKVDLFKLQNQMNRDNKLWGIQLQKMLKEQEAQQRIALAKQAGMSDNDAILFGYGMKPPTAKGNSSGIKPPQTGYVVDPNTNEAIYSKDIQKRIDKYVEKKAGIQYKIGQIDSKNKAENGNTDDLGTGDEINELKKDLAVLREFVDPEEYYEYNKEIVRMLAQRQIKSGYPVPKEWEWALS